MYVGPTINRNPSPLPLKRCRGTNVGVLFYQEYRPFSKEKTNNAGHLSRTGKALVDGSSVEGHSLTR